MRAVYAATLCVLAAAPCLAQSNHTDSAPRTIAVSGSGEVSAEPDRAMVRMGVEAREPKLERARTKVTRAVQSFLKLAGELGIERKRIQTSQLTIRPEYQWDSEARERHLLGYLVARQLTVDLRELDKLGPLMERSVSAGVNKVSGPRFASSREDELRREALRRAAKDARANADVLATTLGSQLGPARKIAATDTGGEPPVKPYATRAAQADKAKAKETYAPGQIKFSAQVTVDFDLSPQRAMEESRP